MKADEVREILRELGMSDREIARALGVTRQTVANWRTGRSGWKRGELPGIVETALRSMMALRRIDPGNETLPDGIRSPRPGQPVRRIEEAIRAPVGNDNGGA